MMKSKQLGSTFLGVLLGAMIGLAVALGVAIYVAKVPIPFVNKGASRTSSQDAAEAERNRHWDPNATLHRNDSSGSTRVPGPGDLINAPDQAPMPEKSTDMADGDADEQATSLSSDIMEPDEAPAVAKPETPRPATHERSRPSDDPLGDLVASRTAPPPKADPFVYFVQAGAFRSAQDADAQRARLSLAGVEARVTQREQAGIQIYRVRVGPMQNQDAANRVKSRLSNDGFEAALVRVQR